MQDDIVMVNCAECGKEIPCGTVQKPVRWPIRIKGRPYCEGCVRPADPRPAETTYRSYGQAMKLGTTRG